MKVKTVKLPSGKEAKLKHPGIVGSMLAQSRAEQFGATDEAKEVALSVSFVCQTCIDPLITMDPNGEGTFFDDAFDFQDQMALVREVSDFLAKADAEAKEKVDPLGTSAISA